jgi:hypothetical protein
MIPDAQDEPAQASRRIFHFRFSLLALLVFVTLVCVLLAWWMQPNRVVATALFRISRVRPAIFGETPQADDNDLENVKNTQVALLKSQFVLQAAVRKPGVASMPVFAGQADPVKWLMDNLVVEFPQQGEVLSISLEGHEAHAANLAQLVDSVAKAYSDEVLYRERQRQLLERDLLSRMLDDLNNEVQNKWDEYLSNAKEAGYDVRQVGGMQELRLRRIESIDAELIRLESEQLSRESENEAPDARPYEQRIAQLREQRAELEDAIRIVIEDPARLKLRDNELFELEHRASELARKLHRLEIESNLPPRIEQLQPAVVSPAD